MHSDHERIRVHAIERAAHVAVLAGALVELGADPRVFPPAVFDWLLAQLDTSRAPDDDRELPTPTARWRKRRWRACRTRPSSGLRRRSSS
jgi:hypothetical protein